MRILATGLAIGLFSILTAGPALAADDDPAILNRVTVYGDADKGGFVAQRSTTGSKSDISLLELPRAVSVVTAEDMRNRAADDLTDIFQYTAGINSDAYGGNSLSRTYSNVRGFLSYQYLDGLKLHDSNWGVEPFGLERAELLKGPGSSLYGQASPGGVVNMVSKRPLEVASGEIELQGGSFSRLQAGGDFTGPIGTGMAYRVTALVRNAETRVRETQDDRIYIAPAFSWRPGDATELTLLGSYQKDPNLTVFQYLPRLGTLQPSSAGFIPRDTFTGEPAYDDLHTERSQFGYVLTHRFSDRLGFTSSSRFTNLDVTAIYLQAGALAANQRSVARTRVNSEFAIDVRQTDNQLNLDLKTGSLRHRALFGFDYASIPTFQGQGTGAGSTLDLYTPVYGTATALPAITTARDQDFKQLGFYVQDHITFGIASLQLGLRRDDAKSVTDTRNPVTGIAQPTVRQDDDATTGQVGLALDFAGGVAPYANYAKSFQPTPGADFAGTAFVPTTGVQYEAGVKYQPPGTALLLTAAGFHLVQQNVRTNDLAHPGFAAQTGEVTADGAELEAKLSLSRSLNLSAAYTWLDNEVTASTTTNLNKVPPGRPEHQASLWADGAIPFAPGLTVGGGIRYVSASFGDSTNTFEVPSYVLVDLLVRYDFGMLSTNLRGWTLAANASNLADKRYVVNCDAATQCFYGQSRVVRATLNRRW